ncbi:hypothetical protein [Paracoccus pacificus]|uniref:Uncharacterized protein n=1 Tax=Paracoccus pacificus TaxID=1463598 RepID=A0ABW4R4V0_9RHOB
MKNISISFYNNKRRYMTQSRSFELAEKIAVRRPTHQPTCMGSPGLTPPPDSAGWPHRSGWIDSLCMTESGRESANAIYLENMSIRIAIIDRSRSCEQPGIAYGGIVKPFVDADSLSVCKRDYRTGNDQASAAGSIS